MNSATIVQKLWNYCNVLRDGDDLFDHYRHTLEKLGAGRNSIKLGQWVFRLFTIFRRRAPRTSTLITS